MHVTVHMHEKLKNNQKSKLKLNSCIGIEIANAVYELAYMF